ARATNARELWWILRMEGVPPGTYLILKVLDVLFPTKALVAFAALGSLVLSFGTYQTLLTLSGRRTASMLATCALGFTDTYFYELGVVVRQYGLSLGLALACFGYLGRALQTGAMRQAVTGGILAASSVLMTVHAGCLAGGAVLGYTLFSLGKARAGSLLWPAALAAPAFLLTFVVISNHPDRIAFSNETYQRTFDEAATFLRQVVDNSVVAPGWWRPDTTPELKGWISGALIAAAALAALFAALEHLAGLRAWGFYTIALCANSATLAYIFAYRFSGSYRHHLFLVMPPLIALLGVALRLSSRAGLQRMTLQWPLLAFAPWFFYQYYVCGVDLVRDQQGVFSQTRALSRDLPQRAHVILDGSDHGIGVLLWRPDLKLRSTVSGGQELRYIIPDKHWRDTAPLARLIAEECEAKAPLFVLSRTDLAGVPAACATRVAESQESLLQESYDVWRIDCTCAESDKSRP
ncbi:MAG TPA: hypothetical protein VK524_00490, partial [Polyangiaceae bacterium]|nr:hypothetical protein [Polyangiaceae bacterium]